MVMIPKCDKCGVVYENGFMGKLQKGIVIKKKQYDVVIDIRPPHLCDTCFRRIMRDVLKK